MDYLLALACRDGRPVTKLIRDASEIRGRFSACQQWDEERRRHLLVASFVPHGPQKKTAEPAYLYDVVLLPSIGESLVLTGSERINDSPALAPRWVDQSWILRPAFGDDLTRAELKWSEAAGEVERLRKLLASMGAPTTKEKRP